MLRYRQSRLVPVEDPHRHAAIIDQFRSAHGDSADLLMLDRPDHSQVRKLVAGQFSIDRIADLRERIEALVSLQLDKMEAGGSPVDLVEAFATPISLATHCALLGVADEDGARGAQLPPW